ncbi:hypothetical protein HPE56_03465 [Maribacter sp. ANRC-HE7]|uniref:Uncharacterized protein n=1 Tax=Maribacter aquimaris TaxID=2737171 RepID=A0ABR7UXB7_9FLAO|nr:DUF6134 family protein [Maribacter aquimaris]MBD0776842.1 hypothetical protein [Maribacter aquimaris]
MILLLNYSHLIWQVLFFSFFIGQFDVPNGDNTSLLFDIIMNDKVIGSLEATRTTDGSQTIYKSLTSIKTKIIKDVEVDYEYNVIFEKSILKKANVDILINQKPHVKTRTGLKDKNYYVIKNGKPKTVLHQAIDYTTVLLFFREPTGINECFSEQGGSLNAIVALGNHSYKKINAKKQENIYYYKNGSLEKADIDGGLIHLSIVARK